jgi:hypothetical protein
VTIRTAEGSKSETESKSLHYSDSRRPKKRNGVRIGPLFGQQKAEKAKWSPNRSTIRTAKGRKSAMESESVHYSDSKRPKKRNGVRIRSTIRTSEGQRSEIESNYCYKIKTRCHLINNQTKKQPAIIRQPVTLHSDLI